MEDFLRDPRPHIGIVTRSFEEIITGEAPADRIAAFLTALHTTGLDRHPQVLSAAATVLRGAANSWPVPLSTTRAQAEGSIAKVRVDIVGTGGDGHNTYNVSTTAAIVCAGHGRIQVVKHGNRASTSASGSADILKSYGCNLNLLPAQLVAPLPARAVQRAGGNINGGVAADQSDGDGPGATLLSSCAFVFLLAPMWHPAMGVVAPVRKALPHPTIFNLLGPLLNPAPIDARIIGVHSRGLGATFIEAFALLQPEGRCMVVCGRTTADTSVDGVQSGDGKGLDEISPQFATDTWSYAPAAGISHALIRPADFGIATHALDDVRSGTPAENAATLAQILSGTRARGDAVCDYVLINAAALFVVAGVATDYRQGVALAEEAIATGRAREALDTFRDASSALAAP